MSNSAMGNFISYSIFVDFLTFKQISNQIFYYIQYITCDYSNNNLIKMLIISDQDSNFEKVKFFKFYLIFLDKLISNIKTTYSYLNF